MSAATAAEAGVGDGVKVSVATSRGEITRAGRDHGDARPGGLAADEFRGLRGTARPWRRSRQPSDGEERGMTARSGLVHLASGSASTSALIDHDPWWLTALKVLFVFLFLMLVTLLMIWAERRVIGRMQQRPGPNRAGKFGLLQSLMDGIKLPLKEDIIPRGVDKMLFVLAPAIAAIPAFISFAIIPVGPVGVDLRPPHAAAAREPAGRRAARARDELDGRLRDRAGRLVVHLALLAARRPAVVGPGDQLRDRDGPVVRARSSCTPGRCRPSQIVAAQAHGAPFHLFGATLHYPSWFAVLLLPVVRDLRDHDGRRDQPAALRPAGGRGRAGRPASTPSTPR